MVRGEGVANHPDLSYDAKLLYVVGALRCNDSGWISRAAVAAAFRDPDTRSTAMNILTKCGCAPFAGAMS